MRICELIYFVQPLGGGPVKIGFSEDVERRRRQLENLYGQPLKLLATMEGDTITESEIHARFSHLRIGLTEQFQPASDLMEFIGVPCQSESECDTVDMMERRLGSRPALIAVKCQEIYKDWVGEFARFERTRPPDLIDRALVEYAKGRGFESPPER